MEVWVGLRFSRLQCAAGGQARNLKIEHKRELGRAAQGREAAAHSLEERLNARRLRELAALE